MSGQTRLDLRQQRQMTNFLLRIGVRPGVDPTMTMGADMRSDFEREEAHQHVDCDRRRLARERLLGASRERVDDLGRDLVDELSIGGGQPCQFSLEALEFRAPDGVESIVKGPADRRSAHDREKAIAMPSRTRPSPAAFSQGRIPGGRRFEIETSQDPQLLPFGDLRG